MSKKDQYRFSIKLDAEDEEHRIVASYLNQIGRKKSRVIVKAMTAWLNGGGCGKGCGDKIYLPGEPKIQNENFRGTEKEGADNGGEGAGRAKELNELIIRNDMGAVDASMGEGVMAGTGLSTGADTDAERKADAGMHVDAETYANETTAANLGMDANFSGRGRMLSLDEGSYEIDTAEVALMRRNYNKLKKG